jgi:hypothetical protein
MIYLTYEDYKKIGGTLDDTAFNRNIDRACGIIDNATHKRIENMAVIPQQAKSLCRDLVEYLANNITNNTVISSKSQSAGGVSESESYVIHSDEEKTREIENMIKDYLLYEFDDNGTSLLYRGCLR